MSPVSPAADSEADFRFSWWTWGAVPARAVHARGSMLGQAGLTAASADWADGEHVQQRNVVESELSVCGVAQPVALRHRRCSHRPVGGHVRAVGLAVADDLRIGFSLSQLWE